MHAIEDKQVQWTDETAIMHLRVNATVTGGQHPPPQVEIREQPPPQVHKQRSVKPFRQSIDNRPTPCKHYNYGRCYQDPPHVDKGSGRTFVHICDKCDAAGVRAEHMGKYCKGPNNQ